jgi:hypothetical protein
MKFKVVAMFAGIRSLLIVLIVCLFITGCANTVTQIVTYGDQMTVQVTLRGDYDALANRYFLVLASNDNLAIPLPPPDNITYEMLEPGDTPIQGTVADYYTKYYDTWSGYVIVDPGGYYLVKGPFVQNQTNTREAIANLGSASKTLSFDFNLSKIFGSTVPDEIYFDFVTVAWPNGQAKLSVDHLTSTNAYISKVSGSILSIDDGEDPGIDAALDIVRCNVEIQ